MSSWLTTITSLMNKAPKKMAGPSTPTEPQKHRRKRLVNEILDQACSKKIPLIMDNTEISSSWPGTFKSRNDTSIIIEIQLNEVRALLPAGAVCSVALNYNSQPHIFLSSVKQSTLIADNLVEMHIFLPDSIEGAGQRSLYRVPVVKAVGVIIALSPKPDVWLKGELQDINREGARIVLTSDEFEKIAMGDETYLSLSLGDVSLTLAADVRHTDTRTCAVGLHFLLAADEKVDRDLRSIIREVESFYIRQVQRLN